MLFKRRHRQLIAFLAVHHIYNVSYKLRNVALCRHFINCICPVRGDLKFFHITDTAFNRLIIQLNNRLTGLLEIALVNAIFHFLNGKGKRNDIRQSKECRLQYRIGAIAQPDFMCDFCRIDDVHLCIFLYKIPFHLCRDMVCKLLLAPCTVEKKCAVLLQIRGHVISSQIGRLM